MPGKLFKRSISVRVAWSLRPIFALEVEDLRVSLSVEKDLSKNPNRAEIQIFNLAPKSRDFLEEKDLTIDVIAGYTETAEAIFIGDVSSVESTHEGNSWITTITAGDGEVGLRESQIDESFAAGSTIQQIVDKIGSQFGGNIQIADALSQLKTKPPGERQSLLFSILNMIKGYHASGSVKEEFDKIMRGMGRGWSIQDQSLQVLGPTEFTLEVPIQLNPQSGLVGSVQGGPDKDGVVYVKARALLQPGFRPGRQVLLTGGKGKYTSASTRVERVVHNGDTHGDAWYSDLELKVIN